MLSDIKNIIEQCKGNVANKIVFVKGEKDKEVTYNSIYEQIDKFSRCCSDISERKKVILQLEDTEKFVVACLTFLLRGIIPVPIDVAYKPEQRNMLNMICNSLDNVCVITDLDETKSIIENKAIEIFNYDELNKRVIDGSVELPKTKYAPDATALLMFSSGSTGNPKAVNISYNNILENISAVRNRWNMNSDDCAVCWMPLTHAMGLILFQLTSMAASSDQVIIPTSNFVMNPQIWLEKMSKYKATISYSPNFGFRHTLNSISDKTVKYDFSKLRFIVNAAEPISVDLCNRFVDYMKLNGAGDNLILPLLGITEVTAGVTSADEGIPLIYYSIDRQQLGIGEKVKFKEIGTANTMSVVDLGKAFSCCELAIKDEDGNILPEDTIGHVNVGGKSVTLGYYQNKEATDASFSEGWLDSGDLGFIHNGALVLTGRYKDVVIINGQNYYLQDIERVIGAEMPNLKSSYAAAIAQTDSGESVAVFVETESNEDKEYLTDEIRAVISEKFGIDIAGVFTIKQLPKTRSGKILRYELSKIANVTTIENTDINNSEIEEIDNELKLRICKVFEAVVGKTIKSDENYFRYGLDSLKIMNIVQRIHSEIGKNVKIADLYDSKTIDNLVSKLEEADEIENELIKDSEHNFEDESKPFELTNIQLSYILGREPEYELGGVATHSYIELDTDIDISRMQKALNITIQKHPMLRTVFSDLTQVIQKNVPEYVIKVEDISSLEKDMQQEALLKERDRMSHEVFNPEEWPLFEVKALKHENGYYLLIGLDMLIMDANGMSMFAKDLFYYYQNPEAPVEKIDFTFRDYVINYLDLKKSQEWENDREYWLGKISEFNGAPTLPLKKDIAAVRGAKYSRIETSIPLEKWSELKKVCLGHNITPSALLCTVYYEILALWSNKTDFSINITTVNKRHFNINVDKILGDFTSSMILCISNVDNNNFWDKAQQIQKCIYEGLEHSLFDGVDFVRELSEKEGLNGKAVLPIVFTSVIPDDIWGNWEVFGDINYSISQTSQVYLDYQASEKDGALHINWDYVDELLDKNMISDMFKIYLNRLNNVLECGTESISIPEYQSSLYKKYNDTKTDISLNTLDGLFLENVEKYPDNIAIVDGDTKVTYKELDRISNQIANKLIELGVMPKDMVCVSARRCYWSIANVLGILKANAAYVPVDEDYPKERIDYIINQSGSKLYLKPEFYVENELEDYDDSKPACSHDLNDTAYVIFTSGSTGKPKGVVIAHGAASNTILDINNKFNVSDKDNIIGISSMCFDLSVYDIFGSLSTGASLVQIKDPKDVENVVDILQKEQITLWNSVPAILDMIVDNANEQISNSSMRHILLSGDWIPLGLPDKARRAFVNSDVTSLGGATEASIWSIYYPIKNVDEKWKSIPYGMPLANQTYYVLNEDGHDCPIGVEGELYIGGIGVAEGYCGDEEKTREAFILHPVYGRIYKTGDYGKFVFDNENNLIIEFMGRRDFQVKIGGFRIELTEIEKNLLKIDGITKCVVIDKDIEAGKKILCAFYVSDNEYEQSDIKEKLGEFLTPYMIPDVITHIEEIPTTRNGKVDRKELLNLVQFEQKHDEEFVAPSNEVEATLMEIFAENLGVEKISVSANLNDYSINSIKSVSIIAQIGKRIGVKLKYKDFTSKKSIKELAAYIYSLNKDNAIQIQQIKEYTMDREHSYVKFPVTEIQYAYIMGRNPLFDIGGVSAHTYAELDGNIDIDRLENSIRKTVKRHPMLRTLFTDDGMQYVLENVPDYEISIIDISDKGAEYKENYLKQIRNEYSHHMFKIDKWPLFDFTAVKLDENKYRLLIGYDLLISDGASASLIGNDIAGYYYDDDYNPEELNFTFRDYVLAYEKIREDEDYLSAKEYWLNRLDTCPVAPTLVMKTDPSKVDNPFFDRVCTRIDNTTWNRISDAAKAHNVTPTALLCTAYAKVLSVWSNQSVVPINMTVFNRYPVHSQINELVGDFTSTMIINADMRSQDNSIWQIASRINNEIMDDIDNRYFDGVEFIRELSKKNNYGVKAVMPYVFTSMLNDGGQKDADSNFSLGMFDYMTSQTPQVFIDCQIIEAKEGILISWDYVTQLFDSEMINTMFNQFIKLFSEANVFEKMEALGLMASEKKILEDYNKTEHSITPELLHSMFEKSVSQYPDNAAVIDGDGQYTYRELNARANQIAYSLRASGIKKGQMILVYAARCRQTIANIMGILKAGGAYVPIDPQYPEDRIQYIMKNSNTDIILYPDYYDQNDVSRFEIENLTYVNELEDTAYVIYTSGSTGRPKGVVISHKAVSNTIKDINERFNVTSEDRMLGISSMCFDLSVYDIFGSLSTGAALVQVKDQRDIFDIKSLIDKYQITIWNSVPAIMDMLVQHINSVYSNSVEIQDKADDICEVDGLMIDRQAVEEKELQYYWSVLYSWKIENDTLIIGENRYTDKEIINLFPEFYYVLSDGCSINDIMTKFSEVQNRKLISFINEVIEKGIIINSIHDPLDLFKTQDKLFNNPYSEKILYDPKAYNAYKHIQLDRTDKSFAEKSVKLQAKYAFPAFMENRQSHRSFKETEAVPFESFSQVISSFRQRKQSNGDIRYYYPCAGGLYPIDIYIYVKDGRVDKLDGGLYYYSPVRDTIELINKDAKIDENSQFYTNKKIFSSSAFTVYFVYNAAVTMPKYSGAGIMYACIDTGIMAEQLVNISEMLGIGTCSIGNIDFEKISHLFNLNKNQVLLHSVECGLKLDGNMCLEPLTLIDQENVNEVQDNDYKNSSLRVVLLSGDWIPVNLSDKIKKIFTEADVISLGGATEASIWSIIYPINHTDPNWKSIPYGRPMYNQQYYVLDYELNDCHIGILGDLYIGGAGLADCYYQNEEASKAFIEHEKYGRLYKTGDCGIMQDDGNIIFMGRKDFQLKINGFRIEAEEIENCLMTHDSVQRAIIVDNTNKFGKKYLCAYVVLNQGQKFNKEELKAHLLTKLPSYMVPSYFVELKEIPLTPNGKVDKKSLPNPQEDENELEVVLPRNNVETKIYDIWKEVLGKTNIGVKDNFFDVGGESLLVMKVHEKIDALYPNVLRITDYFTNSTVEMIANLLMVRMDCTEEIVIHGNTYKDGFLTNSKMADNKGTWKLQLPIDVVEKCEKIAEENNITLSDFIEAYYILALHNYVLDGDVNVLVSNGNSAIKQVMIDFSKTTNLNELLKQVSEEHFESYSPEQLKVAKHDASDKNSIFAFSSRENYGETADSNICDVHMECVHINNQFEIILRSNSEYINGEKLKKLLIVMRQLLDRTVNV